MAFAQKIQEFIDGIQARRRRAALRGGLRDFAPGQPFEWTPKILADYDMMVKGAFGSPVMVRKNEQGLMEYWTERCIFTRGIPPAVKLPPPRF